MKETKKTITQRKKSFIDEVNSAVPEYPFEKKEKPIEKAEKQVEKREGIKSTLRKLFLLVFKPKTFLNNLKTGEDYLSPKACIAALFSLIALMTILNVTLLPGIYERVNFTTYFSWAFFFLFVLNYALKLLLVPTLLYLPLKYLFKTKTPWREAFKLACYGTFFEDFWTMIYSTINHQFANQINAQVSIAGFPIDWYITAALLLFGLYFFYHFIRATARLFETTKLKVLLTYIISAAIIMVLSMLVFGALIIFYKVN